MKFNKTILSLSYIVFLTSCGSFGEVGDALRNEKTNTTDEFLIEKRDPLTLPPNMNELPKPKESSNKINETNSFEKSLKGNEDKINDNQNKSKSNIEKLILDEMKK